MGAASPRSVAPLFWYLPPSICFHVLVAPLEIGAIEADDAARVGSTGC